MRRDDSNKVSGAVELTDIAGVDEDTADELRFAGYRTINDLRTASEDELADVDGVSNPLAARIKAEIGEVEEETNRSEKPTATNSATEQFLVLGFKWYHYAIVLFLSSGALLGAAIGDVSGTTVLMALAINFGIVVALTKLYRWLHDSQGEPESDLTPQGALAEAGDASGDGFSGEDETAEGGFVTTTVPGASETKERRGAIAVGLFVVGMIVAISVFGGLGVLAVLGVLGVLLFFGGLDAQRVERRELATFKQTTGTVLNTRMQETPQGGRKPLIEYEYTVDGQTHEYDKIWPGKPSAQVMSTRRATDFLSSFPEGEETTVYYDPENPSEAYLVRDSWVFWHTSASLVGLTLLIYVILVFLGMAPVPSANSV